LAFNIKNYSLVKKNEHKGKDIFKESESLATYLMEHPGSDPVYEGIAASERECYLFSNKYDKIIF
jgi:hypothetical protein